MNSSDIWECATRKYEWGGGINKLDWGHIYIGTLLRNRVHEQADSVCKLQLWRGRITSRLGVEINNSVLWKHFLFWQSCNEQYLQPVSENQWNTKTESFFAVVAYFACTNTQQHENLPFMMSQRVTKKFVTMVPAGCWLRLLKPSETALFWLHFLSNSLEI